MSARDDTLERLRGRLDAEPDLNTLRVALRTVPGARVGAYARVRRRLDAPQPVLAGVPWLIPTLAAAAVLAAVGVGLAIPRPLDRPLGGSAEVQLDRHVRATWSGTGQVSGVRDAPRIAWQTGTLRVDVDPHEGVDLVVTTREAKVRVVGTVFVVDRDVHGTTVQVERGRVEVDCVRGEPVLVEAGQSLRCAPDDPAGVLAAARAAEAEGSSPADVLALLGSVDAGGDVGRELDALRCGALRESGDDAGAVACVDAALVEPGELRRDELLRTGAAAALGAGDCDRARAWLDALADPRAPTLLAARGCAGP